MNSQIIGTQQIVVTVVFLAVMIVVLIILRRKGGAIRASFKAGKRISVVEDTAVSPTERLRLISIDHSEFVMLSAKGQPPVLMPLTSVKPAPASAGGPPASMGLADIDEAPETAGDVGLRQTWRGRQKFEQRSNLCSPPIGGTRETGPRLRHRVGGHWKSGRR